MNLSFYLWLVYFLGCEVSQCTRYGSILNTLWYFAVFIMCLSPVIVFIESLFSRELAYLKNIVEDDTAWSYIQKMHEVPPEIVMTVECYHYERTTHYTDANGNQQSRTETGKGTKKVTTFVDRDKFSFRSWVDVSKREMPPLGDASLIRVKIDPCILFGDQETEDDYTRQKSEMIARNQHRDDHTKYSSKRQIPGLQERFSTYVDLNVRPWWACSFFFYVASLFMMSWV